MIKLSITGNICSGKTTVSKIFETKGIPVFNSDLAAREAENATDFKEKFIEILGNEVIVDGVIDRTIVREIIFNNKEILNQIEKLVSPYVTQAYHDFLDKHKEKKITCLESAIIFELQLQDSFDYIITVVADKNTRLERVLSRDSMSKDLTLAKMNAQLSDDYKVIMSDFIIINENLPNCNPNLILEKQVDTILKILSK